ncbi:hypothetical protein BLA29_002876, partial [Euroglyphus maynei]
FLTLYARYKQVNFYIEKYFKNAGIGISERLRKNNKYFVIFGSGFSFGLIILGNFRNTEQPVEHAVGFVLLIVVLVSIFFMTKICDDLYSFKRIESEPITIRCVGWIIFISTVIFLILSGIALLQLDSIFRWFDNEQRANWQPDQPGYLLITFGAFFEWLMINCFPIYFFSISHRMRNFNQWHQMQ